MRFGLRRVALRGRRHRPEQDGDVIEQPVGPGKFEERVDEDQDQPDAFDLPQRRRGREVDRQRPEHGQRFTGEPAYFRHVTAAAQKLDAKLIALAIHATGADA